MAKQKKMVATQRGKLYGKITNGNVLSGVDKNGNGYESYRIHFKEKNTKFFFMCDVYRNLDRTESEGRRTYLDSVKALTERANKMGNDDFIESQLSIYPTTTKDDKTIQFTWTTSDVFGEGQMIYKLNSVPRAISTPKEIEDYNDNNSKLSVSMIVDDIVESELKLKLISDNGEYQKVLYVYLDESMGDKINSFEIGYGYEMNLKFKNGGYAEIKDGKFAFDDGDLEIEPSKLIVTGCRILKNLMLESDESDDWGAF